MDYRTGIGYDMHLLAEERKLFIGGVEIPYIKGLLGHSDGDVLLHAISDALLGAAAGSDIGEHFPDTDPEYSGISSAKLLKKVLGLVRGMGYKIVNIDTVVIAQKPVLSPFKKLMQERISEILELEEGRVNVKAKTNEGRDSVGREESIASYASVLLSKGV